MIFLNTSQKIAAYEYAILQCYGSKKGFICISLTFYVYAFFKFRIVSESMLMQMFPELEKRKPSDYLSDASWFGSNAERIDVLTEIINELKTKLLK